MRGRPAAAAGFSNGELQPEPGRFQPAAGAALGVGDPVEPVVERDLDAEPLARIRVLPRDLLELSPHRGEIPNHVLLVPHVGDERLVHVGGVRCERETDP